MTTDATPVTLDVDPEVLPAVRGWVETLGWQVVDPELGDLLPPVLRLTTVAAEAEADAVPSVLLVDEHADPVSSAERAGQLRPHAVLRWPDERERLPEVARAAAIVVGDGARPDAAPVLRIGAAAGGVGATTVALAIGGLSAWRGPRTLVVGRGDVPCGNVAVTDPDVVEGETAWRAGVAAPGVPGLRVVATAGAVLEGTRCREVGLLVVEVGVSDRADVLVLRRDAAGLAALRSSEAAVAVVVDQGPAHPRDVAEAAGGRRLIDVPFSARVARAGLARRVPAGLPGAWLRTLAPIAREI